MPQTTYCNRLFARSITKTSLEHCLMWLWWDGEQWPSTFTFLMDMLPVCPLSSHPWPPWWKATPSPCRFFASSNQSKNFRSVVHVVASVLCCAPALLFVENMKKMGVESWMENYISLSTLANQWVYCGISSWSGNILFIKRIQSISPTVKAFGVGEYETMNVVHMHLEAFAQAKVSTFSHTLF